MISVMYLVWMYVILLAIVGLLRGWAKELLVSFSVVVGLTLNHVLRTFVPALQQLPTDSITLFWVMVGVLLTLVFFGYQTLTFIPQLEAKAARERLQDALFGTVIGGLNGYLISGSVLYYLHQTNYTVAPEIIGPPAVNLASAVQTMMSSMPPMMLAEPQIYFALILCFIFVIVVYV